MTKRLIEEWLPIAELGEESMRERRSMTALPPIYYLHVWWARRPLVASRAAVLASLLPADADRKTFMHMLGIHGDPVAAKKRITKAKKTGEDLGLNVYGYPRAFQYSPSEKEEFWLLEETQKLGIEYPTVLDPTAGGGAIPFESLRLGCKTLANDINPVAVLVQKATYEWPAQYGRALLDEFNRLTSRFMELAEPRFQHVYPAEPPGTQVLGYLWARTIHCPYCAGKVPLSPNWKLDPDGTGVKLVPHLGGGPGDASRYCNFEIVGSGRDQSEGTVKGGDATCPFPDCSRVIDGDQVKAQAQTVGMGEQLYAVVIKRQRPTEFTKAGKPKKAKWERGYRSAVSADDNSLHVRAALDEKLPEWEALDLVPSESIEEPTNYARGHIMYGMTRWRNLFSPRQLLAHGLSMEIFHELHAEERSKSGGELNEPLKAAFAYLAIAIDRLIDWNSRQCIWDTGKLRISHTFAVHGYAIKWSHAEMAQMITGGGFAWTFRQTEKCINELVSLITKGSIPDVGDGPLFKSHSSTASVCKHVPVTVSCVPGDSLSHLEAGSVDAVVMDPPYYDNVMYGELSDFFYVWLKRSVGRLYPELFASPFTDKKHEAVANPAIHKGKKGAKALAGRPSPFGWCKTGCPIALIRG